MAGDNRESGRPGVPGPWRRRLLGRIRVVVAAAATIGLTATGVGTALAVAHGRQVPEGRYPFGVKLTMPDITRPDGSHYSSACSASLVAPQWIMSAGHCFHDGARHRISGPVRYRVIATVGTADLESGYGIDVDVVEVRQAPTGEDVALAELERPVEGIEPIALSTDAPRVGDRVRLAGWGWTGEGEQAPSTTLRTGTFTITSVTAGTVGVVGLRPAADTSACVYDSGAPYFAPTWHGPELVSVESQGPTCPHVTEEITARVDTLADWARQTIS
ncbi:MAG TPA: trypsin-like serine protease [Kineosporiaceae bacterium]